MSEWLQSTHTFLRAMFGSGATFRSREQAEALHLVTESTSDAIVILPTGLGKSVLFSFPVYADFVTGCDSISILIVPLCALEIDITRRMIEIGLLFNYCLI